jgi:hypothetical protein
MEGATTCSTGLYELPLLQRSIAPCVVWLLVLLNVPAAPPPNNTHLSR